MLSKKNTDRFKAICKELDDIARSSICSEGDIPYVMLSLGYLVPEGPSGEEFTDGESVFYFYGTTPDVIRNTAEYMAERNQEYIDAMREADSSIGDKDSADINSWLNIDKDRLN